MLIIVDPHSNPYPVLPDKARVTTTVVAKRLVVGTPRDRRESIKTLQFRCDEVAEVIEILAIRANNVVHLNLIQSFAHRSALLDPVIFFG